MVEAVKKRSPARKAQDRPITISVVYLGNESLITRFRNIQAFEEATRPSWE